MKAIQVTFSEPLLAALDATDEVRRDGRSAVMRRAVAEYLRRRQANEIAEQYRAAYDSPDPSSELEGWEEEGQWPET